MSYETRRKGAGIGQAGIPDGLGQDLLWARTAHPSQHWDRLENPGLLRHGP